MTEPDMERELFTLEPAADGWCVHGELGQTPPHPSMYEAYEHARHLAHTRYMFSGHPTGVVVTMQCGDVVLADPHG